MQPTGPAMRLWQRAHDYLQRGQVAPARAALEALLARDPDHARAHLLLGGLAWMGERSRDAARHALEAARCVPDDPAAIGAVVAALLQVGENVAARACLERPVLAGVRDPELLMQLAGWHQMLGAHARSLALYGRARAAGMDGPEFRFHHATQLSFNGRLGEARQELQACVGMGAPHGRACGIL